MLEGKSNAHYSCNCDDTIKVKMPKNGFKLNGVFTWHTNSFSLLHYWEEEVKNLNKEIIYYTNEFSRGNNCNSSCKLVEKFNSLEPIHGPNIKVSKDEIIECIPELKSVLKEDFDWIYLRTHYCINDTIEQFNFDFRRNDSIFELPVIRLGDILEYRIKTINTHDNNGNRVSHGDLIVAYTENKKEFYIADNYHDPAIYDTIQRKFNYLIHPALHCLNRKSDTIFRLKLSPSPK